LRTRRRILVFAAALAVSVGTAVQAHAEDPNALWTIVHDQCVPDQQQSGDPAPCAAVDLSGGEYKGFAVLKDLVGARQFLLIPTGRLTGIESPELLAPDATNYFADAWRARSFVDERAGRTIPRDWMSLAINSSLARSQNQLHIHVDCVRADVHDALIAHGDGIGTTWAPFPVPLADHRYDAIAIKDLDATNPFRLLADGAAGARRNMGDETLVVVGTIGAKGQPGFVALADRADPAAGDLAEGEQLQDHESCPPAG
jgi:CDP-diacylglycerol pyrophosphatase